MKKKRFISSLYVLLFLLVLVFSVNNILHAQPDPTGAKTGTIQDVPASKPGEPTISEVADAVGHNRIAENIMWTLITGFLVMFMQAGFAMVETGFTRAKNVAHTMGMNFMVYGIGVLGFWICGFALMFGGVGSIANLGGTPGLTNELTINILGKSFGLVGFSGFFLLCPEGRQKVSLTVWRLFKSKKTYSRAETRRRREIFSIFSTRRAAKPRCIKS